MNALKLIVTIAICSCLFVSQSEAQRFKLPFGNRSNSATQKSIYLEQKDGPWLIMCASFSGEDGRQQAIRLAGELREKHRLNAYVYAHEFDFSQKAAQHGRGWEVYEVGGKPTVRQAQMRTAGADRFEEIAVVVGDFSSVEESKAQKTLEKIKYLQPESMAYYDSKEALTDDSLAGGRLRAWRDFYKANSDDPNQRGKGPMMAAFMMPNPLLPDEYFAARKIDDFVLSLNQGLKYSLLKNPGTYSVKIATFSGESTLEADEMKQKEANDSWLKKNRKGITDSKLVNAAKRATVLTAYLRGQGINAYEFHDRHESYVCVGEFDWTVKKDAAGNPTSNLEILKTIEKFKGSTINLPGKKGMRTYPLPTKLSKAGIACDVQPIPVLVRKGEPKSRTSGFFGMKR